MVLVSDEILMAYADGELPGDEARALEAQLGHDAALRARLAPFVETRQRLAEVFAPALDDPIPDRLIDAILRAPASKPAPVSKPVGVPSLGNRLRNALSRALEAVAPGGLSPALAASAAALLVVGGTAGWIAGRNGAQQDVVEVAASRLVASGALAAALEQKPSGTAAKSGAAIATPVLSFTSKQNEPCREYRVDAGHDRTYAGLACRTSDGVWRVALHVRTLPQASPAEGYQTATGSSVAAVDALVETMIAGSALGADEEAAMLKERWRAAAP